MLQEVKDKLGDVYVEGNACGNLMVMRGGDDADYTGFIDFQGNKVKVV